MPKTMGDRPFDGIYSPRGCEIEDVVDGLLADFCEVIEIDPGGDRGGVDHVKRVECRFMFAREIYGSIDRLFGALVTVRRNEYVIVHAQL